VHLADSTNNKDNSYK